MVIMCVFLFGGETFLPETEDALDKHLTTLTK